MNESKQAIAALANRLWSVHPKEIQDLGITRPAFYEQEISTTFAALRASAPQVDVRAALEPVWGQIVQFLLRAMDTSPKSENVAALAERMATGVQSLYAKAALSAPPSAALDALEKIAKLRPSPDHSDCVLTIDYARRLAEASLARPQPDGAVAGNERGIP